MVVLSCGRNILNVDMADFIKQGVKGCFRRLTHTVKMTHIKVNPPGLEMKNP